jgi:large subunit ribosomal protein L9
MKVILKKAIENLGETGQVVSVKPGFARNYLLPQGFAYEASGANLLRIEEEQKAAEERAKRDFLDGRRRISKLDGISIEFRARASEEGKLFGSVSAADILERLNAIPVDFEVERKHVLLEEPLKEVGTYQVVVRLMKDVEAEIEVRVEPEEG